MISTVQQMVAKAEEKASTGYTFTREDGTNVQVTGHATYEEGDFQVYVVTAEQRTRRMKTHYRATFYIKDAAGGWKRTNRAEFERRHAEQSQSILLRTATPEKPSKEEVDRLAKEFGL